MLQGCYDAPRCLCCVWVTLCGTAEIFRAKTLSGASRIITWMVFVKAEALTELVSLSLLSDGQQIWEMEASVDKDKSQPVRISFLPGICVRFQQGPHTSLLCRICCLWRFRPTETHPCAMWSKSTSASLMAKGSAASLSISPSLHWQVGSLRILFVIRRVGPGNTRSTSVPSDAC